MISVIVPVLNEEKTISSFLQRLTPYKGIEIILVDAKSTDRTVEFASQYPIAILKAKRGRAYQLNCGAEVAKGDVFLFLHADCFFEEPALENIKQAIKDGFIGGAFSQKIMDSRFIFRLIEFSGNLRARLFKIFYGDQAIFVRRDIFSKIGGFDEVSIFEDVLISRKMKQCGKTVLLKDKVYTCPRRWQKQGIIKTTLINWFLTLCFIAGVNPDYIKKFYKDIR